MPYKISGYLQDPSAKIIVIKETDWGVEITQDIIFGNYAITSLVSGTKSIVAVSPDGEVVGFGSISPVEYFIGDRGVFPTDSASNVINYITISSPSAALDFGDCISTGEGSGSSNGVNNRGIFNQGSSIQYISISTPANSSLFGNLSVDRSVTAAVSNNTNDRSVFIGGAGELNVMDYITITSLGDSIDFGDLIDGLDTNSGCSNSINDRGITGGGSIESAVNIISYITISSLGNATDFGDLTGVRYNLAATSNGTNERAIFGGGSSGVRVNTIDYITITSIGNAADFGDLLYTTEEILGTSNLENERGVFLGGLGGGSQSTKLISYITISSAGNAVYFGSVGVRYGLGGLSDA